eukprot:3790214-Heterocapsa_arctica.AAC.1
MSAPNSRARAADCRDRRGPACNGGWMGENVDCWKGYPCPHPWCVIECAHLAVRATCWLAPKDSVLRPPCC